MIIQLIIQLILLILLFIIFGYRYFDKKRKFEISDIIQIIIFIICAVSYITRIILGLYNQIRNKSYVNNNQVYTRWDNTNSTAIGLIIVFGILRFVLVYFTNIHNPKITLILFPSVVSIVSSCLFILITLRSIIFTKPDSTDLIRNAYISSESYKVDTEGHTYKIKSEIDIKLFDETKFNNVAFIDRDTDTSSIVFYNDDETIISFPGTSTLTDVVSDIKFYDIEYALPIITFKPRQAIHVHYGFYKAYFSVRDKLINYLRDKDLLKKKVTITGHSLGGAVGTICAFDLVATFEKLNLHVYTYGSPSVGDRFFVDNFNNLVKKSIRVVNGMDPVPLVLMAQLPHVNNEYRITDITTLPGIHQHSLTSYINAIKILETRFFGKYLPLVGQFSAMYLCMISMAIIILFASYFSKGKQKFISLN